jgi:tryptophan-rich sensory protein
VFIARGAGPFYLAYGSSVAQPAAAALTMLPKNLAIVPASLSSSEVSGGESLLRPLAAPFPWKTPLLWAVLVAGAGLLAWMAYRLSKDVASK